MELDHRMSECSPIRCPECKCGVLVKMSTFKNISRCEKCKQIQQMLRCSDYGCKFRIRICDDMTCNRTPVKNQRANGSDGSSSEKNFLNCSGLFAVAAGILLISLICALISYSNFSDFDKDINVEDLLKKLKKDYPSQRNETWYHFFSVLEKKVPAVKSIIFLHGGDKRTAKCLMNELVSLFSGNKNIGNEDLTFSDLGFQGAEYGLALEYYRAKVKSSGVFVADLTNTSGNIARIFHSLCDEVSSDIKPSLFVFSIQCDRRTENLKPLERATTALKEKWTDLPISELFPLLSRVVKNVIDIVPETEPPC